MSSFLSLSLPRFSQDQIKVKLGEYDFKQEGETGDKIFTVTAMKLHEGVSA
jgi:hypothetical protein